MMKASQNVRWRPFVGVIAVGALAFGLSLRLEGAPAPGGGGKATDRAIAVTATDVEADSLWRTGETVTFGNLTNRMKGEIPIMPTIVVDYTDDEGTRLRNAGLLVGPLPMSNHLQGGVASTCTLPNCSFAIECDDGKPCTSDTCDFPVGGIPVLCGGTCNNTPVPNGQTGSPGDLNCVDNFGSLCLGCNDGVFCNGIETCQGATPSATCNGGTCDIGAHAGETCTSNSFCKSGGCTNGTPPCTADRCSETFNACQTRACTAAADDCQGIFVLADDNTRAALQCNGAETCDVGTGICQAGTNPCGAGAQCGELACTNTLGVPPFCTSTNDCIIEASVGFCTVAGPICLTGRCCTKDVAEPVCTSRVKCDDRPPFACLAVSCDGVGGLFYPTDAGATIPRVRPADYGVACPLEIHKIPNNCPRYSSGVAPFGAYTQLLGPISDSPVANAMFGVHLQKLGDDYKLSNDPGAGSDNYFKLRYLRFAGGMVVTDRISFEIYDKSGNFIEDLFFNCSANFGLYPVAFKPALVIPSEGFIVARVASSFSPSARIVWAATDVADVGTNDANVLWLNNGFNKKCTGGGTNMCVTSADCPGTETCSVDVSPSNFETSGVLAFELEGEAAPAPGGACCTGVVNACDNAVLPWVCKGGVDDVYLGDGTVCAACNTGTGNGKYCRRCSSLSANPDDVCNKDSDCPSGSCVVNSTSCQNKCVGSTTTAVNGRPCLVDPDCAPGGTCSLSANLGALCIAEAACGTGACCNPTTGTCMVVSETTCTSGGGTYQGNGTDCDADNGRDNGLQHCCPQPVSSYTGRDNCEDAGLVAHVLAVPRKCIGGTNDEGPCNTIADCPDGGTACVPNPGVTKVITITGSNSGATSTTAAPDSCFLPSTDPNADPGWWEAFEVVDDCAMIRLDQCCSDPVERPTWSIIYDSCPCGSSTLSSANPYAPSFNGAPESGFSRGLPYCADDDNLWQNFPFLTAGTYYYPVYSALAGGHGEYQLHMSIQACTRAACCVSKGLCVGGSNPDTLCPFGTECLDDGTCTGAACIPNVHKLECDKLGGFFLAPPNKYPDSECSGPSAPCDFGSCCQGPGRCTDISLGQLITPALCTGTNTYNGGVRCLGGQCASGSPPASCATDDECGANRPCNPNPLVGGSLTQQSPCPICEFQDVGHCQLYDDILSFTLSDRHLTDGLLMADDFIPQGTTLTHVCAWGFYINGDPNVSNATDDCGPAVTADHFRIRIYNNDPVTGRMPGTLFAEKVATLSDRAPLPTSSLEARINNEMYGYQITVDTGGISGLIPDGRSYWIEISNDPTISSTAPQCMWFWSQKAQTSSSISFAGTNSGYTYMYENAADMAFCTNFGLTPSTMGESKGACCFCNGTCQNLTLVDCTAATGIWHIEDLACPPSGAPCPSSAPSNDLCASGPPTVGVGTFTNVNNCAKTDGYGPILTDVGSSQIDFDMWYYFMTPSTCDFEVNMCATGTMYDSAFAVYANCPTAIIGTCDPTVCPPCPLLSGGPAISAATLCGTSQDESCTGAFIGGPGLWVATNQIGRKAVKYECFLLRIGSYPGRRGTSSVTLICDCTLPTECDDGLFCNGAETCVNGTCMSPGNPCPPSTPICHEDTNTCTGSSGGPPTPIADPSPIKKPRFISFSIPPTATATVLPTALRVKLTSLHHVDPPYAGATIPFTLFEGQSQYAGKPKAYVESSAPGIRFAASQLQCAPYYRDWASLNSCSAAPQFCDVAADCKRCTGGNGSQACNENGECIGTGGNIPPCSNNPADTCSVALPGLLAVTGEAVVPSSSYDVENLAATCAGNEETCTDVSAALTITTGRWGDVYTPFQQTCAEQGGVACPVCNVNCVKQPDFDDISALVNKFKSAPGAPIKARALLAGETGARGLINMEPDLGFSHISADVDAFKKLAYPYKPGRCTGNAAKACISDADCTNVPNPTTGPCVLECVMGTGRPCVCP